jgi:hypothetical protein
LDASAKFPKEREILAPLSQVSEKESKNLLQTVHACVLWRGIWAKSGENAMIGRRKFWLGRGEPAILGP